MAGELVGYPPAMEEDCTLWVALQDQADEWEGVLGKWSSEDEAEIVGIPVFAYDLDLGDVVRVVRSAEGAPVVSALVAKSGNHTFRVWFDAVPEPGHNWRRLMTDLEPFDCWFDTWSERLIAISVSATHAQAVADYLRARESESELEYEMGASE